MTISHTSTSHSEYYINKTDMLLLCDMKDAIEVSRYWTCVCLYPETSGNADRNQGPVLPEFSNNGKKYLSIIFVDHILFIYK